MFGQCIGDARGKYQHGSVRCDLGDTSDGPAMLTMPWNVSMPVLRCTLIIDNVTMSVHARNERPRGVTSDDAAWKVKVESDESDPLGAKPQEIAPGKEEHDVPHDGDWHKGHEQDARAEKERMARMRHMAWCDFCGNHAPGRKCCYGCKQIGVKT